MASEKAEKFSKPAKAYAENTSDIIESEYAYKARARAFDSGQAAKEAEINAQPRSPEPIKQTRARFARDEPEAADILRDYEESDEEWAICALRDWEMYLLGAGHPRGTPFKEPGK